jgi:hypothetical protein
MSASTTKRRKARRSGSSNTLQAYEIEFDSKKYQVEVELLENTEQYLHVMVAVDDGSLPASIRPLTHTFIRPKEVPTI